MTRLALAMCVLLLAASCCPPCTSRATSALPRHAPFAVTTRPAAVPPECQPSVPRDCNFRRTINGTNYCCGHDAAPASRSVAARRD